ncbi:hypothetical protein ONZ51_g9614 [Trametes cubensis]|uniref:Uncharacterized protein n=1 Tax=Trametes cubensis TaxID=1111947 RepID=A0AAD7X759_9APHY|nr:hypothetical protein ONZ51_g9614 [Trametes cubensis]
MSDYNPYVAALKADQHLAVHRANSSRASSSGSLQDTAIYDEPPPSYEELTNESPAGPTKPTIVMTYQESSHPGPTQMPSPSNSLVPSPPQIPDYPGSTSPHAAHAQTAPHAGQHSASSNYASSSPYAHSSSHASTSSPSLLHRSSSAQSSHPDSGASTVYAPGPSRKELSPLLNPPPPSFQRAPAPGYSYAPFEPLHVPAIGHTLEDGFVSSLPRSRTQPHPFAAHDVAEADWTRFLGDLKRAGAGSLKDRIVMNVAPVAMNFGRLPGLLASMVCEDSARDLMLKKQGPVLELIHYWNEYFFYRRSMEVVLTKDPYDDYSRRPDKDNEGVSADQGHQNTSRGLGLGLGGRMSARREERPSARGELRTIRKEIMSELRGVGAPKEGGGLTDATQTQQRAVNRDGYGSDLGAEHTAENIASVPYIGTFASNIAVEDLPSYSVANLYPQALSSKPAAQKAFALCALRHHRKSIVGAGDKPVQSSRDVLTEWRKTAQLPVSIHDLDTLVLRVWAESAEDGNTAEDVEDVLWSAFPINPSSTVTVRVIDFLANGDALRDLSRHPLVYLSLTDTWKYGRHRSNGSVASVVATLARFLDRCGTPRVMHLVDLFAHLVYLGVLYNFVSWPPYLEPIEMFDTRRTILIVFSLAKLLHPWTYTTIPPLMVFSSFVLNIAYYGVVYNTLTFTMLLFALYLEVLLIHFPATPSPLLLLRPDFILPLSVVVRRSMKSLLVPIAYFLPGLVVSDLMLGRATSPSFHFNLNFSSKLPVLSTILGPGPIDAATLMVYAALFLTLFLFFVCTVVYSAIVHPFLAANTNKERGAGSPGLWDRYTDSVGMEARREYFRAVRRYGTECYFPTPFNLVHVLVIQIPRLVLVALRRKRAVDIIGFIEKGLWRVMVGPVAFLVSGLWLWYLRF